MYNKALLLKSKFFSVTVIYPNLYGNRKMCVLEDVSFYNHHGVVSFSISFIPDYKKNRYYKHTLYTKITKGGTSTSIIVTDNKIYIYGPNNTLMFIYNVLDINKNNEGSDEQ